MARSQNSYAYSERGAQGCMLEPEIYFATADLPIRQKLFAYCDGGQLMTVVMDGGIS
jgi:hypothetical protein